MYKTFLNKVYLFYKFVTYYYGMHWHGIFDVTEKNINYFSCLLPQPLSNFQGVANLILTSREILSVEECGKLQSGL